MDTSINWTQGWCIHCGFASSTPHPVEFMVDVFAAARTLTTVLRRSSAS